MPRTKTTTKKVRKSASKRPAKRAVKKRAPRKSTARVKKSVLVEEPETPIEVIMPNTELPKDPEPEPIAQTPMMADAPSEPQSDNTADEVEPMVSETHLATISSRIMFYLGVVTGAAVLHVLVFALVAIMNS